MHGVLGGLEEFSGSFVDDILTYSYCCWEEHLWHIKEVLERLRISGLMARLNKCVWGAKKVEYLGLLIGDGECSRSRRCVSTRNL